MDNVSTYLFKQISVHLIILLSSLVIFLVCHYLLDILSPVVRSYAIYGPCVQSIQSSNIKDHEKRGRHKFHGSQINKTNAIFDSESSSSEDCKGESEPIVALTGKFKSANHLPNFNWLRIKNLILSLVHSVCASVAVFYLLWRHPVLLCDPISATFESVFYPLSFIGGYFLSDAILNLTYRKYYHGSNVLPTIEIMIHHLLSILGFAICFKNSRYQGALLMALLAEVHNIFLHTRSILALLQWQLRSVVMMNFCNLLIWRCLPLLYLTTFVTLEEPWLIFGLVVLSAYVIVMGTRLFRRDFLIRQQSK